MDPIQVAIDTLVRFPDVLGVSVYVSPRMPARVTIRRYTEPKFLEFEADTIGEALNLTLHELGPTIAAAHR